MPDAPATPISDTKGKDKETLVSIVKEMTESMTVAQSRYQETERRSMIHC